MCRKVTPEGFAANGAATSSDHELTAVCVSMGQLVEFAGTYPQRPLGVYFNRDRRKWQAKIKVRGQMNQLGRFDSPYAASEAYERARATRDQST